MSTLFSRGKDMLVRDIWTSVITEEMTLKRRTTSDSYPTSDTVTAIRRVIDKRDARVGSGLIAAGTMVFILQGSTVTSAPRPHDKLVDENSVEYMINFAQYIAFDSAWRCETTRAV